MVERGETVRKAAKVEEDAEKSKKLLKPSTQIEKKRQSKQFSANIESIQWNNSFGLIVWVNFFSLHV